MLEEDKPLLDPCGAMDALLRDCATQTGIAVKQCIARDMPLSAQTGSILYSCLREGLTNSLRHGHCTAVDCSLHHEDGVLHFSLTDNGAGATAVTPGFGLRAMRTRVEEAGGSLHIQTESGRGFSIQVRLPA